MKKNAPFVFALLTGVLLLDSCANTKELAAERKTALQDARLPSYTCFVQLVDGTIQTYTTLQLVTGVDKAPHLLADGKTKLYPDEIVAYQNKDHFAVSAAGFFYGGHKSNLAVETLPGFAVRIAAGRLNVYVKKYKAGHIAADEFFLQEGNGQAYAYSPELLDALIKNNPEALDFFNNNKKHIRLTKQLKATAYIFNNTYFNTVATSGKRKVK